MVTPTADEVWVPPVNPHEQIIEMIQKGSGEDIAAVGVLLHRLAPDSAAFLGKRRGFNPSQPRDWRGRWLDVLDDDDDDDHGRRRRDEPTFGEQVARSAVMTAVPAFAGAAASVVGGRLAQEGMSAIVTRIAARGLSAAAGA